MPSAIKFTIGADSSQFAREMLKIEGQSVVASAAHAKARRITHEREVAKYQANEQRRTTIAQTRELSNAEKFAKEKAYREKKAAIMGASGPGVSGHGFRQMVEKEEKERQRIIEQTRGGYMGPGRARGWGGASSAMFVSVARDTMASLASGANPITVFMQQMPQVMQAFVMMGKDGFKALTSTLSSGLQNIWKGMGGGGAKSAIGAGLGAIGIAAAYEIVKSAVDAFRAEKEFDATRKRLIANELDAIRKYSLVAQELYATGRLSREKMLNISAAAASGNLRGVMSNLPPQLYWTKENQNALDEGSDYIRRAEIDAMTDQKEKARRQAKLDRDIELRKVSEMAATSTIPASEFERVINAKYDARIKGIDAKAANSGSLPITEQQRVGAYIGGPQFTMIDLQRKHLTVAQQQLALIKAMKGGKRGVNFGGTS